MGEIARAPESGEDRLIARFFRPLATHPGARGLIDDAATLKPPPGSELVVTTDAIVGGVHFFLDDPADLIARKALRVNLSDLAAKGARPLGFLLALALADGTADDWLEAFARGLGADDAAFDCPLLGGDTVRTPGPPVISVTAIGAVPEGRMVPRDGAKAGDRIVVTGTIGDAALGLRLRQDSGAAARWSLDGDQEKYLAIRYLLPQPRLPVADALRGAATAAMDVSDGLAGDLAKLCRASGVDAEIEVERVPLSVAARKAIARDPAQLETVLSGGDDYEIIATMPGAAVAGFREAAAAAGVVTTEIGCVVRGPGQARLVDRAGLPIVLARSSFSHF